MSGLMLNDNVPFDLMLYIMSVCQKNRDMELSHFYAEVDDGKCQMVAHYPGNGVFFPTRSVVVHQWGRVDALGIAKTIARDLNTIFGLEDPN